MANRYANLVGSNKIKDEWQKINTGFDLVQVDMDEKADADDLVNLENVVNSHIGAGGNAHAKATDQQAGFMSATDKQKLDGIEEGAQVNQNAFARVNDVEASDPSDDLTITGGTGITISTNPNTKTVTVTATGTATPGAHGSAHTEFGADPIPLATPTEGGLMSADHVQMLESHASRHAADGADPITPTMIGAETPAGAQAKADQAETNAKAYADATFLPAAQYTAADVLNKIKTVDGAGSGLDADTVRGYYPSTSFVQGPYIPTIPTNGAPLEIGQYIDFHLASSVADFDGRIHIDTNKDLIYSKPGVGNFRVWTAQMLRWNPSGYLEYNDGGVWRSVTTKNMEVFTSNGTFVVPPGVNGVYITACGAGGGGGGSSVTYGGGGGGGGGACVIRQFFPVTPGQSLSITIGQPGIGGGPDANGSAGGATVISPIITLPGGAGGTISSPGTRGGVGGGRGGEAVESGGSGAGGNGGRSGDSGGSDGGEPIIGVHSHGGKGNNASGVNGGTGAYGAGGGGGGGGRNGGGGGGSFGGGGGGGGTGGNGGSGGNGGAGIVIIEW